jgi:hypothetical protein
LALADNSTSEGIIAERSHYLTVRYGAPREVPRARTPACQVWAGLAGHGVKRERNTGPGDEESGLQVAGEVSRKLHRLLASVRTPTLVFRMRSSAVRRALWLLFSFWFGPSLVVPEMIDQCPVHQLATGQATGHTGHAAMAGRTQPPADHASHKGCTCPDQGCATTIASPPSAGLRIASRVRLVSTSASISRDRIDVASVALLLPPTTGPPPRA